MSVGIVTVAVGETYRDFLEEWATAIRELSTPPDHYVIVTDRIDEHVTRAIDLIPTQGCVFTSTSDWKYHPQVLVNEAIQRCDTEWIIKMDADDLILPDALDDWPDGDVIMYGIRYRDMELHHPPITAEGVLAAAYNPVFSGSAYRRRLWENNHYRDMIFEDWAFWRGCASQGARFTPLGRCGYVYREHDEQVSRQANEAHWTRVVMEVS